MFDWKSRAFPGYKPVRENFLTKIVDVHWPGGKYDIIFNFQLDMAYVGGLGIRCSSPVGPVSYPAVEVGTYNGGSAESITWALTRPLSTASFTFVQNPVGGGFYGDIVGDYDPPELEERPEIVGFPSCDSSHGFAPFQYVARGLAGVIGPGPYHIARGARGDCRIKGVSPPDQKYVKTTSLTVLAHGDSFTSGPACRGDGGALPQQVATHTGKIFPDVTSLNNMRGPMNYGDEYAQMPLDFSGTHVMADTGGEDGPERYNVVGISFVGGSTGTGATFVPPDEGTTDIYGFGGNNNEWNDKTIWMISGNSEASYRPGTLGFSLRCRKAGQSVSDDDDGTTSEEGGEEEGGEEEGEE